MELRFSRPKKLSRSGQDWTQKSPPMVVSWLSPEKLISLGLLGLVLPTQKSPIIIARFSNPVKSSKLLFLISSKFPPIMCRFSSPEKLTRLVLIGACPPGLYPNIKDPPIVVKLSNPVNSVKSLLLYIFKSPSIMERLFNPDKLLRLSFPVIIRSPPIQVRASIPVKSRKASFPAVLL